MQNELIEKATAFFVIRENAADKGNFRREPLVLIVWVPTLIDMEGWMARMWAIPLPTQMMFMNDVLWSGLTSVATKE